MDSSDNVELGRLLALSGEVVLLMGSFCRKVGIPDVSVTVMVILLSIL